MRFAIVFALGFLYLLLHVRAFENFLDEGFNFNSMLRILHGEVPYRDFFTLLFPGNFYFGAVLLSIFGVKITVLHVYSAVMGALFPALVFFMLERFTRRIVVAAGGWLFALSLGLNLQPLQTSYSWSAMTWGAISMLSLVFYVEQKSRKWAYAAGVFLFLSLFFKQTIGLYFGGAYLVLVLFYARCKWLTRADIWAFSVRMLTGVAVPLAIWLGVIAAQGSLHDMWLDTFVIPLTDFQNVRLPPPSIEELQGLFRHFDVGQLFPYLFYLETCVLAAAVILLVVDLIRRRRVDMWFVTSLLFAMAAYLHNFERASFLKVRTVLPLVVVVLFLMLWRGWNSGRKGWRGLVGCIAVVLVFFAGTAVDLGEKRMATYTTPLPLAEDVRVQAETAAKYKQLVQAVERVVPVGERIFVYPMNPSLYALLDCPNPTRYDLIIPANYTRDGIREIERDLEEKQVKYLIFDENFDFDGRKFLQYEQELDQYIHERYRIEAWIDDRKMILVRRDLSPFPPAKGSIDSPQEAEKVHSKVRISGWLLDGDGVDKLTVLIDGKAIGETQYGELREDVFVAFPQYENHKSGYSYLLDTAGIANGPHTLAVQEVSKKGRVTELNKQVIVQN